MAYIYNFSFKIFNQQAWREVTIQQQEKLAKSDDPVLNIKSISEKIISLDREVRRRE